MAMTGKPSFRKPVPEGVVEHVGLEAGEGTAMVELEDGSLMLIAGSRCHTSVKRTAADAEQNLSQQ